MDRKGRKVTALHWCKSMFYRNFWVFLLRGLFRLSNSLPDPTLLSTKMMLHLLYIYFKLHSSINSTRIGNNSLITNAVDKIRLLCLNFNYMAYQNFDKRLQKVVLVCPNKTVIAFWIPRHLIGHEMPVFPWLIFHDEKRHQNCDINIKLFLINI